ncbi:TetR/AcrR family transcriptional regulator [Mycolicibacterium llatzerense]|uniref:TetR/AcrR family transcriptional regulator n=1 Tax=Mycolicibacterium llatzerense TaxID=280871 RepID=UPI0021B5E433|nr:TetR/AcrR family transcriptional regulator [Mycolicibacterium llatzerense]
MANGETRGSRPRGRPRLTIENEAIADAVAELLAAGGYEAVGVPEVAERLEISRATMYRVVPTKSDLLGILFEVRTRQLSEDSEAAVSAVTDSTEQLAALIRLQAEAAVNMRRYMPVFFGGGDLPPEVFARWHSWSKRYEDLWVDVVTANIEDGNLKEGDPQTTARLILGAMIWVSRWYRPVEKLTAEEIAETAVNLLGIRAGRRGAAVRTA